MNATVSTRIRRLSVLGLTLTGLGLSGCHLTGDWRVLEPKTAKHDRIHVNEPSHIDKGATYELKKCKPVTAQCEYRLTKATGLHPRASWDQLELVHPDPELINKLIEAAKKPPKIDLEDICKKHCAIGDLKLPDGRKHVVLLDEVEDRSTKPCETKGTRCVEVIVFCLSQDCKKGVFDVNTTMLAGLAPIHKGSAHSHNSN